MDSAFRGSGDFVPRHELDRLSPTSAISVRLASPRHLADLVAIARREIPGVSVSEPGLAEFLRGDPESIFCFRAGREPAGRDSFPVPQSPRARCPVAGGHRSAEPKP